uniref:Uncharacterized protein n=1 Tax=Brassica oleracea var. oleracea TaxID=109376 RepID=A0A0D3E8J0_BRAOL
MNLSVSALTSKIEAIQGELVEIQSYIAHQPEATASIDRRNNISTDICRQTSVDDVTNRGRLVPKVKSDMSDTHHHGEEISADTYATLRRHQFNLESLEDRLQRMENTTATMKEKWSRGDEAMRDFTGTWSLKKKIRFDGCREYRPTRSCRHRSTLPYLSRPISTSLHRSTSIPVWYIVLTCYIESL